MGWVTGIIPLVVCLMTAVNSSDQADRRGEGGTLRTEADQICSTSLYTASNHRGAVLGKPDVLYLRTFRRRKYKPAYYDSCVSFVHRLPDFSHMQTPANCSYTPVSQPVSTKLGLSIGGLAVRYFIVGVIVILIRGLLTEQIYFRMTGKANK